MTTEVAPHGISYFLPPRDWFWQWQEQGQVAAWHDGPTIAFRDEIEIILRHLAPQGLPPLGSLLMLLGACRESWNETPGRTIGLLNLLTRLRGSSRDFAALRSACEGLDRIHALPNDLRSSFQARAELAATVFETARQCTSPEESKALLDAWPRWRAEESTHPLREASLAQFLPELHALLGGMAKVDERTLRLRLQTSLENLPTPASVPPEEAKTARALLDRLVDDPELSGIARLARQLLAVVSLPRPMADPTDLPEGGVSDISNRGPLDRLLLSELASDETTLAVRVAMNEALYYRRETPPSPPPQARRVLIDSGVRMWGLPRVFAAAVGLALAAQPDKKVETTVFRANGRCLEEADFATKEGLAAHLAALETAAHPGEALAKFFTEVVDDEVATEGVLITCDEVLADSEFQHLLARRQFDTLYLASVSREGRYRLLARSQRGEKVLREATLDLEQILAPRPEHTSLVDPSKQRSLPAIFHVDPFPLLLSVPLEADRSWHVEGVGVFSYTRDGRLLHWHNPGHGARQLAEGLPPGRLFACELAAHDGELLAVIGKQSSQGLYALRINYETLNVTPTPLTNPHPANIGVAIQGNTVLLRHQDTITAVDAVSGEVLDGKTMSRHAVQRGRIFRVPQTGCFQVQAVSYDGITGLWATNSFETAASAGCPLAAFEVQGIEGIVSITSAGDIEVDGPRGRQRTIVNHGLKPPFQIAGLSRDGLRFVLQGWWPTSSSHAYYKRMLVDTLSGAVREVGPEFSFALEPYLGQYMRPRILRHKFIGIGVDAQGQLTLVGKKRNAWPIEFDAQHKLLRLADTPSSSDATSSLSLERMSIDRGYSLHFAQWPDGTTAWLDSRGLLHLRSSDAALPEMTLVLCAGPLAGWLSDGRCWGARYFYEQSPSLAAWEVSEQVLKPLIDRITP